MDPRHQAFKGSYINYLIAEKGGVSNDYITLYNVHFVKYDVTVSFYDAVSDTIRRRGGYSGIFWGKSRI